ncbi:MAG: TonB-dependent receptor [Ignavibacteriales bacterium]|nr:TonB-dependent receptor [Ignavibacteriales bacterium]
MKIKNTPRFLSALCASAFKIFLLFVMPSHFLFGEASAQQRGIISGSIFNKETNENLVGANILLQGTVLGTTSDGSGNFLLKNIHEGKYSLAVSLIGFHREIVNNIFVKENEITFVKIFLSPTSLHTSEVIVTANRSPQSLSEIPVSVSVVDAAKISQRNAISADQSLRYVSGVNVSEGQINIRGFSGYTKGVGSRVLLLVDGMPMLAGDTQEIIWEAIPVSQISKIEIVKGAGSATYGSSALGGVVNIITKEISETPQTTFKTYGGIWEQPKYKSWKWSSRERLFNGVSFSRSEKINDAVGLFYGISHTQDDSYKRNDYWRRWNIFSKLNYTISSNEKFIANFSLLNQKRGNFLYWKSLDEALIPQDDQLKERVETTRMNFSFSYNKIVQENLSYTFRGNFFYANWSNIAALTYKDSTQTHSRSFASSLELFYNYQMRSQSSFTFGVEAKSNLIRANLFGERNSNGFAAFIQEEEKFSDFVRTTIGVRSDFSKVDSINAVGEINPKAGIVYTPTLGTTFRASIGSGFRAPSVAELFIEANSGAFNTKPNPKLLPEKNWSFEIGGNQILSKEMLFDVSLFESEFNNLIEPHLVNDPNVAGLAIRFDNVLRARLYGMEMSLQSSFFENDLQTEISFTHVVSKDVHTNQSLKYRPRNLFYVSSTVNVFGLQLGADFRSLSRVEKIDDEFVGVIPQGDRRVPIYVFDARVAKDFSFVEHPFGKNISCTTSLQANNILQYYYNEFIGTIAPIRNFVLTVEVKM